MMSGLLFKNVRAVDERMDRICDVLINGDRIAAVGEDIAAGGAEIIDGRGLTLIPSLFDMHVHFRDPGYEYKEDIITGCAAAAAGGVTGVVCMPNTKPPADDPEIIYQLQHFAGIAGSVPYIQVAQSTDNLQKSNPALAFEAIEETLQIED